MKKKSVSRKKQKTDLLPGTGDGVDGEGRVGAVCEQLQHSPAARERVLY